MSTGSPKTRGSPPEAYSGKAEDAENFWSALDNYYWLNRDVYTKDDEKVSAALTHFKVGTPAGHWACEYQKAAMSHSPVTFGTWKTFQKAFDAHFVPADAELAAANSMHSLRMGNRPFNEWYQDWSVHAARSNVDEKTKMFAFRKNLPEALHNKLLGLSPQPTTLAALVEKTRAFDNAYHLYKQNRPARSEPRGRNARTLTTEERPSAAINYANLEAAEGKITPEEREQRFREKLCLYCGRPNHRAKECRKKLARTGKNSNKTFVRREMKACATNTQEDNDNDPSPSYDHRPVISSVYSPNCFDPLRPASASLNDEDF
jgi:hypothetical protein